MAEKRYAIPDERLNAQLAGSVFFPIRADAFNGVTQFAAKHDTGIFRLQRLGVINTALLCLI